MPDKYFLFAHHFMQLAYFHRKKFYIFWSIGFITIVLINLLFLFLTTPFTFSGDFNIKYSSYHNIEVEIKQHRVYGKLNKYITVAQRNNQCYREHCGFPSEGNYMLDELQFITLSGNDYIKKMCVRNSLCYHNLYEDQLESYLIKIYKEQIDQTIYMLWVFICINILFYPAILYAIEHQRKKEEIATILDLQTEHQSEMTF